MLDKSELELKVEQLEIIELETKAHNGWLTSDTNESFKLRNLFNRKHQKVRQIDHSVFKMIRSAYLGLFSVGIDCCDRLNNVFGLKKFMFYLLHHLVMILLIFFTITNLMAIILSKNNTLQLIIEFIRMFTVFYRFFCLKLLKKKSKGLWKQFKIVWNCFLMLQSKRIITWSSLSWSVFTQRSKVCLIHLQIQYNFKL